jgi:hypothetical protein
MGCSAIEAHKWYTGYADVGFDVDIGPLAKPQQKLLKL